MNCQVDVDIATHIDIYDDGPDRRYDLCLALCFIPQIVRKIHIFFYHQNNMLLDWKIDCSSLVKAYVIKRVADPGGRI